jgi:hypothetical protein
MRLVKTHLHNTRYASCGTRVSSKIHLWSTTRMDVILHQNSSGRCWNRTVNPRLFQHVNHSTCHLQALVCLTTAILDVGRLERFGVVEDRRTSCIASTALDNCTTLDAYSTSDQVKNKCFI